MPMRTVRRRRVVLPHVTQRPKTVWPRWPGWSRPLLALFPLACVALGGATERWSQGLTLLGLGVLLMAMPPRTSLGRGLNTVLGALLLLSATAFLPAHWFYAPVWRTAMSGDFGVALPATLSPQPFLTAESLVVFAAGLGWFYLLGTIRWTDDERRRAGMVFAGGTVALAAVAVLAYRAGWTISIWPNERHFGPFPNRNQTADFFALGALPVLACGRVAWRAGHKPASLAWLAGWLVVALAVFHSFSRAGIILLVVTTAIYLGVETFHRTRHQKADGMARWRRVALVATLALIAGSGLLLFGSDTLARLRSNTPAADGNTMSNALRRSIYVDTANMIAQSPWCGTGLNTFNEIFPAYRRTALQNPLRVRHPESDWLWLTAELGWPGLLAALAGTALIVRKIRPPKRGNDRPLRLAAALGVLGFLGHSVVDVSAHRIGSAFAALFLLGLALPGSPVDKPDDQTGPPPSASPWLPWLFRGAGAFFVLVGVLWTMAALGWLLLPGEQGVARLQAMALRQGQTHDAVAAYQSLTKALAWSPLDWRAYYSRGAVGVYGSLDQDAALADFQRARYLENVNAALPGNEAQLWLAAGRTAPAVNALLEACRRDPSQATNFVRALLARSHQDPAFLNRMIPAARRDPILAVALLGGMEPPESTDLIADIVRADPDLQRFDDHRKTQFFQMWALRGNPKNLVDGMTAHPAWQQLGWRWWAEATALSGTPEATQEACKIVARFAPKPLVPVVNAGARPLEELRRNAQRAETGPEQVLPLYQAQNAAGDTGGALRTLQQITPRPDCPVYFHYLEAQAAATVEQWPVSWAAWQKYLQAIKANE